MSSTHKTFSLGRKSRRHSYERELPLATSRYEQSTCRLGVAIGIIARFAVRHDLAEDEIHQAASSPVIEARTQPRWTVLGAKQLVQVVKYLSLLFPCGALAPPAVERADGSSRLSAHSRLSAVACFCQSAAIKRNWTLQN